MNLRSIIILIAVLFVTAIVALPAVPTTTAQDDTEALRARVLAAYDNTLNYTSGAYIFTSSEIVDTELSDATGTAYGNDSTFTGGGHSFVVTESGPNVASSITVGRVISAIYGEESTLSSDTVTMELRLVDGVLYLSGTVETEEGSVAPVVSLPDGWVVLADVADTETLGLLSAALPVPLDEIDYSFYDFTGESQTWINNRALIATATDLTSTSGTNEDGTPIEIVTITVDTAVYLELLLSDMSPEEAVFVELIFQDAEIIYTAHLDADGNLVGGGSSLSVNFFTDDLSTIGFPPGTPGSYGQVGTITLDFDYILLGEEFPLAEAPAEALPLSAIQAMQ